MRWTRRGGGGWGGGGGGAGGGRGAPGGRAVPRPPPPRSAPDYDVEPLSEPRPATAIAAARAGANGRPSLGGLVQQAIEAPFGAFARGRGDEKIERTIGSGPGMRIIFKAMEQSYIPEKAAGFEG